MISQLRRAQRGFLEIVEHAAIDVGWELIGAKREHPGRFMEWVARELPFGIDKAERIMAVTKAFATTDPEVQRALPSAWTTLFELSRLPIETVQLGVASGDVNPTMTRADARQLVHGTPDEPVFAPRPATPGPKPGFDPNPRLTTEIVVTELLRLPRTDLSDDTALLLHQWLGPNPTETP